MYELVYYDYVLQSVDQFKFYFQTNYFSIFYTIPVPCLRVFVLTKI